MVRTRVKGNGSKAASSPSTEPNLYAMEPCYEQNATQGGLNDNVEAKENIKQEEPTNSDTVEETLPPVIEDHQEEDDSMCFDVDRGDADIVLKPVSNAPEMYSGRSRTSSCSSLPQQSVPQCSNSPLGGYKASDPALVSPMQHPMALVSPPHSPCGSIYAPMLSIPSSQEVFFSIQSEQASSDPLPLHSGDQVFFEGLPFHYLETKDVEDNSQIVGV